MHERLKSPTAVINIYPNSPEYNHLQTDMPKDPLSTIDITPKLRLFDKDIVEKAGGIEEIMSNAYQAEIHRTVPDEVITSFDRMITNSIERAIREFNAQTVCPDYVPLSMSN